MDEAKIRAYSRKRTYWEIRCVFDNKTGKPVERMTVKPKRITGPVPKSWSIRQGERLVFRMWLIEQELAETIANSFNGEKPKTKEA